MNALWGKVLGLILPLPTGVPALKRGGGLFLFTGAFYQIFEQDVNSDQKGKAINNGKACVFKLHGCGVKLSPQSGANYYCDDEKDDVE